MPLQATISCWFRPARTALQKVQATMHLLLKFVILSSRGKQEGRL